jgi:hypothetical protein
MYTRGKSCLILSPDYLREITFCRNTVMYTDIIYVCRELDTDGLARWLYSNIGTRNMEVLIYVKNNGLMDFDRFLHCQSVTIFGHYMFIYVFTYYSRGGS